MMRPRILGLIGAISFVVVTRATGLESVGLRDPSAWVTQGDSARADFVHAPGYRPEIERRLLTRSTSMPLPEEPFGPPTLMVPDGAWSWFGDLRAVTVGDKTYVGWVNSSGDVEVGAYEHTSGVFTTATLAPRFQIDDHVNPSILPLADGRLMVFYSVHAGYSMFSQVTLRAGDITGWESPRRLYMDATWTYPNPVRLSAENDRLYLFWRGTTLKPKFSVSNDGITWSETYQLVETGERFVYVKYADDGVGRIHFAFTNTHPEFNVVNNIYHAYYEGGAFFTMDGTRIGGVADLPLRPEQVDVVYDSEGSGARAWIWGIALDADGNPVIVYATFRSTREHMYRYARWDGQAWTDHAITPAGESIDETGTDPYYSAGITLDPESPDYVYLCRDVNGVPELERWITTDGGSTWIREPITTNSIVKNARPVVPRNRDPAKVAVIWLQGRYTSYLHYQTSLMFATGDSPRIAGLKLHGAACGTSLRRVAPQRLSAVVIGGSGVDASALDPHSLRLNGQIALEARVDDVASNARWLCASDAPDGANDLVIDFDTTSLLHTLRDSGAERQQTVRLTGRFHDGSRVLASTKVQLEQPSAARRTHIDRKVTAADEARVISYHLASATHVHIAVYDVAGRRIEELLNALQPVGNQFLEWNTRNYASGVYFLKVEAADSSEIHKFVLLR